MPVIQKKLFLLRHGQAVHNPRAEKAKDEGCSHETFIQTMKEDDALDAPLTALGQQQAIDNRIRNGHKLGNIELVVSSPLSRALCTADLTICPENGLTIDGKHNGDETIIVKPPRIVIEDLREINGYLLNAKRRSKDELMAEFHDSWDFTSLTSNHDDLWTDELESQKSCAERCYQGLIHLMTERQEQEMLMVAHGGLFRFVMMLHPNVIVVDDREERQKRFGNCELRQYDVEYYTNVNDVVDWKHLQTLLVESDDDVAMEITAERPLIVLKEVQ
ncbi:hypothetical protein CTEN210_00609 [Chaetoceros tenuissimus]|uniref:Uncharacterized protein n=1 Tax=Chaetoceros tenuissimus TaxID=426638 RepID=A0AAD3GYZ8_9STRA|nr:hypothetical protein CTEN210_00609 [Chaetoceros tenuissimus]